MKRYRKTTIDIPEDTQYIKAEDRNPNNHELKKFSYPVLISIDTYINVDKQGNWTWEDETICQSADRTGNWYIDYVTTFYGKFDVSEYELLVVTGENALGNLDEIIEPYIPTSWGRYRIRLDASLVYDISGIEYFWDDSVDAFEILNPDDFSIKFNSRLSSVQANTIKIEREE